MKGLLRPRNILVLTGSPRKNGNSDRLADAFIKVAQDGGHHTMKFETAFKNIAGCRVINILRGFKL